MIRRIVFLVVILIVIIVGFWPYTNRISFKIQIDPISVLFLMGKESNLNQIDNGEIMLRELNSNDNGVGIEYSTRLIDLGNGQSYLIAEFDYVSGRFLNRISNWIGLNNDYNEFVSRITKLRFTILEQLSKFDLDSIQIDSIDSSRCVCKRFLTSIDQKANLMNSNIDLLASNLGPGKKPAPLLVIDDLNFITDRLDFSLCFPIEDKVIQKAEDHIIRYLDLTRINYSAKFVGNYSLSHYNWARVYYDSLEKGELIFPWVEVYLNNPFSLSNDRMWVSKVFFEAMD